MLKPPSGGKANIWRYFATINNGCQLKNFPRFHASKNATVEHQALFHIPLIQNSLLLETQP